MKKSFILALLFGVFSVCLAQPNLSNVSYPTSVKLYELFEIAYLSNEYDNPYDPDVIDMYAEFTAPNGRIFRVNGFYFEGYHFEKYEGYEKAYPDTNNKGWRIRFTPNQVGTWRFIIHAKDKKGKVSLNAYNSLEFSFVCNEVNTTTGFISVANKRFLKRDAMENGSHKVLPFYPIGPNIAWYSYAGTSATPKGIYEYDRFIDAIAGSANYMRIWLNRYQYLSLYGPEFTQKQDKKPIVYFDSTLNQKDAAELDHIVTYAAQHGINLMPCIFTFGDFCDKNKDSSKWDNNPFRNVLGLKSSTLFFSDKEAKRISKNLIRYIVARWGYATNIVSWELWNEVDNIPNEDLPEIKFNDDIVDWHNEMASYIRTVDPFKHPISSSNTSAKITNDLFKRLYTSLDFVQIHTYGNIQKANPKEERCLQLFEKSHDAHFLYPDKPCFIGEFGFGQSGDNLKYKDKDPKGIDTRNCLWSTMFASGIGPASFWYWDYLDKLNLLRIYEPMMTFSKNLPLLSDSFSAYTTAETAKRSVDYPNGIQTYYLVNAAEDSLYGWCQDTAFNYQALRRLCDKMGKSNHFDNDGVFDPSGYVYTLDANKKPKPSSRTNNINLPISNPPVGSEYVVKWYDAETGLEMVGERTTIVVKKNFWSNVKYLPLQFPSSVRDLQKKTINNTYGDAVFIITLKQKEASATEDNAKNTSKKKTFKIKKG